MNAASDTAGKSAYQCNRLGLWYFYPTYLSGNMVVTGGSGYNTFYGEGSDDTNLKSASNGPKQVEIVSGLTWIADTQGQNGNGMCCNQVDATSATTDKCKNVVVNDGKEATGDTNLNKLTF